MNGYAAPGSSGFIRDYKSQRTTAAVFQPLENKKSRYTMAFQPLENGAEHCSTRHDAPVVYRRGIAQTEHRAPCPACKKFHSRVAISTRTGMIPRLRKEPDFGSFLFAAPQSGSYQ
jgi:hypothetical protein